MPRVLIVDGHGWGHGRGMGQYGARALAESGTRWFRILPKYYTGISLQRQSVKASIRVLLAHASAAILKGDANTSVRVGRALVASSRSGRAFFRIARSRAAVVIEFASQRTGPWRRVAAFRLSKVSVTARHMVGLVGASTTRWYRGAIILAPSGSGFAVIDNLSLEQYIGEVVPREMPASWPIEALRAQAVAARTYAQRVSDVARARHKEYDICGNDACQVFGGYARTRRGAYEVVESYRSNVAVQSTAGWIMTWKGKPILAEYSSSTGGYTASGGVPYLSPRADPWDMSAPLHSWSETVDVSQIQARWPAAGAIRSIRLTGRDGRGDFGGRADWLVISGSRGTIYVSTTAFQYAFGLPSDWFRLLATSGQYRFTFNMSYGTHNAAVRFLQERLRSAGFFPKTAPLSSYFGPITRAALERYQRAQHINPTGFLGPMTRARLNASAS
jgi:SpoIID/LytB domain protein